jgi:hypothetical protein
MFENNIRLLDYYFFGIGIVSLMSAVFLLLSENTIYYALVIFHFTCFFVSFFLNSLFDKQIKEAYFQSKHKFVGSHVLVAIISAAITITGLILFKEMAVLITYFLAINLTLMIILLIAMYFEFKKTKAEELSERRNLK